MKAQLWGGSLDEVIKAKPYMGHGEFLWCDLATFGVDETLRFYRSTFGWTFNAETFPDGSTYHYASNGDEVTAGIYEMPDLYRKDGMSSFWMTYIGVDEIGPAIDRAAQLGGKLILGPASFGLAASIAMISDPFGAVFTIFSGRHLQPRKRQMQAGLHVWDELVTPDPDRAAEFYSELFDWKIDAPDPEGRRVIRNLAGSVTAEMRPSITNQSGTARWCVGFGVSDSAAFRDAVSAAGGTLPKPVARGSRGQEVAADPVGAVFAVMNVRNKKLWID